MRGKDRMQFQVERIEANRLARRRAVAKGMAAWNRAREEGRWEDAEEIKRRVEAIEAVMK